jgi:hypothetical protein
MNIFLNRDQLLDKKARFARAMRSGANTSSQTESEG